MFEIKKKGIWWTLICPWCSSTLLYLHTFTACTRTGGNADPNIAGSVSESSILDFDINSGLYRTDTTIEGINGGTDTNSGITLTIARTPATPDAVDLNDLVELVTQSQPTTAFGSRTYIRLRRAIDRDVSLL